MTKADPSPFTKNVIFAITLLYAIAGTILFTQVGPWEAIRQVVINGVILAAWLMSANLILRHTSVPDPEPVHHPTAELVWTLGTLGLAVALAAVGYAGAPRLPRWAFSAAMYLPVLLLFLGLGYRLRDAGIVWPPRRSWLALLAIVLLNVALGIGFDVLLPEGEAVTPLGADMAENITGLWSALTLLGRILLIAAIPEELLFRATLQPRLARFLPLGWAMLVQALLFSAAHLPQKLIGYQQPAVLALAYSLTVNNGLIGGYLWWRTRSLPLLVILHLFAYPRWGL